MNWEKQKYILIATVAILLMMLAFLLGAAYGVSSDQKQFIETFIPVFSTIGSWVSGIGALGAVFVSLWLSEKQNQKDREKLNLSFRSVITTFHPEALLCIEAVSVGTRPSNISSLVLANKEASHLMALINFAHGSTNLPSKLGYGEKAYYFLLPGAEMQIGKYIKEYCSGSANNVRIYVNTTTEVFTIKIEKEMQKMLESHAK